MNQSSSSKKQLIKKEAIVQNPELEEGELAQTPKFAKIEALPTNDKIKVKKENKNKGKDQWIDPFDASLVKKTTDRKPIACVDALQQQSSAANEQATVSKVEDEPMQV